MMSSVLRPPADERLMKSHRGWLARISCGASCGRGGGFRKKSAGSQNRILIMPHVVPEGGRGGEGGQKAPKVSLLASVRIKRSELQHHRSAETQSRAAVGVATTHAFVVTVAVGVWSGWR